MVSSEKIRRSYLHASCGRSERAGDVAMLFWVDRRARYKLEGDVEREKGGGEVQAWGKNGIKTAEECRVG